MKRKLIRFFLPVMLIVSLFMGSAYAATAYQEESIAIGSSNQVVMVGVIEPSVMSVIMPTYVPFNVSRSLEGENKVISPRITITNQSSVPVSLDVVYTSVDLSNLNGTTWSDNGQVGENQIAIGFQMESIVNEMPTTLNMTKWLVANREQNINIMSLEAFGSASMYVVGTLGNSVPENTYSTFSVIPIFVVSQA